MNITRRSPVSGKTNTMDLPITAQQAVAYMDGALVQEAFPQLTPDQREFIMTGVTSEEWETMFNLNADEDKV